MSTYAALIGLLCICVFRSPSAAMDSGLMGHPYQRGYGPYAYSRNPEPGLIVYDGAGFSEPNGPTFGKMSHGYKYNVEQAENEKVHPTLYNFGGKPLPPRENGAMSNNVDNVGQESYSGYSGESETPFAPYLPGNRGGYGYYEERAPGLGHVDYRGFSLSKFIKKIFGRKRYCRAEKKKVKVLASKLTKCETHSAELVAALNACHLIVYKNEQNNILHQTAWKTAPPV